MTSKQKPAEKPTELGKRECVLLELRISIPLLPTQFLGVLLYFSFLQHAGDFQGRR